MTSSHPFPQADVSDDLSRFAAAVEKGDAAFLLDFDGVCARIDPESGKLPTIDPPVAYALQGLSRRGNDLAFDSGRPVDSLLDGFGPTAETWAAAPMVGVYGRAWLVDGKSYVGATAKKFGPAMRSAIGKIQGALGSRGIPSGDNGLSVQHKTWEGVSLAYRWSTEFRSEEVSPETLAFVRAVFATVAEGHGLEVVVDDLACELRCPGLDKGVATREMLQVLNERRLRGGRGLVRATLCIGDERSDRPAFEAAFAWAQADPRSRTAMTVFVESPRGDQETQDLASVSLRDQRDVSRFLTGLGRAADLTASGSRSASADPWLELGLTSPGRLDPPASFG